MADKLSVYLSGDAWSGNARARITVNDVAVGGELDVSAVNNRDDVQTFTFEGAWGANPKVGVSFINDAGGGTPDLDRNLYLEGFAYNGVEQRGLKVPMYYHRTVEFDLTDTAAPVERVHDFMDRLGVDVHLNYLDTAYGVSGKWENDIPKILKTLEYIGIDNLRVGLPDQTNMAALTALAAAGIKFNFLMPAVSSDDQMRAQIDSIKPFAASTFSVEAPNEINLFHDFSFNGRGDLAAGGAYQKALDDAVDATPWLAGRDVYALTLGGVGEDVYRQLGDLSQDADVGNMHVYFPNGMPPADVIRYAMGLGHITVPGKPMVFTETNYTSAPGIKGSVTEAVQAKYDLDLIMDAAQAGVKKTFFYELLDQFPDPKQLNNEHHYGLFRSDGSPKPVATAIHNMNEILHDVGATATTFTPGTLGYSVSGLPGSGNSTVLAKSSGAFDVVIWAEPEIWDVNTQTEVASTTRAVTLKFDRVQALVEVFDPLFGTSVIATYRNVSSVTVDVTDHPVIVQTTPAPAPGPAPAPVPAPTPPATGANVLLLTMSEDAYKGDAQFTVKVDGMQQGGVHTVTALHAAGKSQQFSFNGDWGAGRHKVSIDFVNDAWSDTGDRNIHVEAVQLGAARATGAILYSGGVHDFDLVMPPVVVAPPLVVTPPVAQGPNGSGPDRLVLRMSEDAYKGDVQFVVKVDGVRVGDVHTVTALHSKVQAQDIVLNGDWKAGVHKVDVTFANDLYGGTAATDRNLHLEGATYNGKAVSGVRADLHSTGDTATFRFEDANTRTLLLTMSEDAYKGDARFLVKVDGVQVGDVHTVTASHAKGQTQEFALNGGWGEGSHKVTVDFLNDLWDGTASTDRNLYVEKVVIDGATVPGAPRAMMSGGAQTFVTGHDLVLNVSEDAYKGDAKFTVSVDGVQQGGVRTATASHAAGQSEQITLAGQWAAGRHDVAVAFLNDFYEGSAQTDRNLYIDAISVDGIVQPGSTASMMSAGILHFDFML